MSIEIAKPFHCLKPHLRAKVIAGDKTETRRLKTNLKAGDLCYIREPTEWRTDGNGKRVAHYVDDGVRVWGINGFSCEWRWKRDSLPQIHMPREFARYFVRVEEVRREYLHDIGKDGRAAKSVMAEGITAAEISHWKPWLHADDAPAHTFSVLWDSINGKVASWASNPVVYVVRFTLVTQ